MQATHSLSNARDRILSIRHTKARCSGFSLIELLVATAIIALLIAILVPVLGEAKVKARQTACSSNMRQLGMATISYAAGNDNNVVPLAGFPTYNATGVNTGLVTWAYYQDRTVSPYVFTYVNSLLQPYAPGEKILLCPEAVTQNNFTTPTPGVSTTYGSWVTHYGMGGLTSTPNNPFKILAQLTNPQETFAFGDAAKAYSNTSITFDTNCLVQASNSDGTFGTTYFHGLHNNHSGNIAYYDGHAEPQKVLHKPVTAILFGSAAIYNIEVANDIGSVIYGNPDLTFFNSISSSGAYTAAASTYNYDWYFWMNKDAKR